jgi:hypothetical protein
MSSPADFQTDTAQGKPNPSWKEPAAPATKGGCGCTGGRRHRRHTMKKGGVGVLDDALFAVGTSYAAKRWGQKKRLGGRHTRKHRGGAGVIDDALVAGTALGLAHYFTKKGSKGGRRRKQGGGGNTASQGPYVPSDSALLSGGFRRRAYPRRMTRRALV